MRGQITGIVGADAGSDDGPAHATCSAEGSLARDKDVRDVLILAKQGEVHHDRERGGVTGQNNELRHTAVHGLGGCREREALVKAKTTDKKGLSSPSLAPFLIKRWWVACCKTSRSSCERVSSAMGQAEQMVS